jgi:CHAT domain-containing protein
LQDHVGNYVVSSYVPSMSALYRLLTESNVEPASREAPSPKMLLVGQPTSTAGHSALANVEIEIEEIKSLIPPQYRTNIDACRNMTVSDTLDGLGDARVLHLACHGHQDQDDPLNSGFDLDDGRLTLAQLMQLNMPDAQLAYLSACDSAGMDETRPDEGLNLAGTMIFVGFRSVVGTMW